MQIELKEFSEETSRTAWAAVVRPWHWLPLELLLLDLPEVQKVLQFAPLDIVLGRYIYWSSWLEF